MNAMEGEAKTPAIRLDGGSRLDGKEKESRPGMPLVSIITATFNASEYMQYTIDSIRELSYENVEWIVVDGGSKDNTIELLEQNEDVIDYWISEADNGIYDAWNKGILLARGDWLAFLGAGDSYYSNSIDVYMTAINSVSPPPEFASSRVRLVNAKRSSLRVWGAEFKWRLFKKYMTVAHVGALHHRKLFEKEGLFDLSYSSAADYEFLVRCGEKLKAVYLNVITADMLVGGVSGGYKGMVETCHIQRKYGVGISAFFRLYFECAKRFIRPLLRGY